MILAKRPRRCDRGRVTIRIDMTQKWDKTDFNRFEVTNLGNSIGVEETVFDETSNSSTDRAMNPIITK